MTHFKDYLSDKYVYAVPKIEVDFTTWHENISRKEFADYFWEYLKTLSTAEWSRVAEIVLSNQ